MSINRTLQLRLKLIGSLQLTIIAVILNMTLTVIFASIAVFFDYSINSNFYKFDNLLEEFFFVSMLGPILETVIYQYFLTNLIMETSKRISGLQRPGLAVVISAVIFGYGHSYNYLYMIAAFFIGLSLNVFYLIIKGRKLNAFFFTTVVHSLCNSIVFALQHLIK